MSKVGVQVWFHRLFNYAFIIITLFIAYIALFLSSYGIQPWDKFFATGGSLLLSIISMYFGYKIERQRHRRENEVVKFETFIGEVGDLMEQVNRMNLLVSQQDNREARKTWQEIRNKNQVLLDTLPSLLRISDKPIRDALEEHWDHIKVLLEVLNQITTENSSLDIHSTSEIYNDMMERLSLFRQVLINYEQTQ